MKKIANKLIRNEKGQALPVVLILMVIGGLIIAPLLSYTSSSLIVSQTYEEIADELYAADAGVEDGLWQIGHNNLDNLFGSYDPYDYDTEYEYPGSYPVVVNDLDVDVSIENVWVPDIDEPDDVDEAHEIIGAGKLIIAGILPPEEDTQGIKIYYYHDTSDPELHIETIGVWIPPGFSYDTSQAWELETTLISESIDYSRQIYPHCGGEAVVWTFLDTVTFDKLPNSNDTGSPWESYFKFKYIPSVENRKPEVVSWMTTSGVSDIEYTWDADVKVYHIVSEAGGSGGTTVEAYAVKSELRELGSAIAGDYRAIGNTLMIEGTGAGYNPDDIRYELLDDSEAVADDIPSSAHVEAAFLYWSGWVEEAAEDIRFYDECDDIDNGNWTYGGDWQQSGAWEAFYAHHGPGHRRLEMANQLDLSSYESGSVTVSWQNRNYRDNRQEGGDCFQYAFGDSSGWDSWTTVVCDDIGTSWVSYEVTVPDGYLVPDFRMRFRTQGYGGNQEYLYIDNVKIAVQSDTIADTSIVFEIDGDQVYFADDIYGNPTVPTIGSQELTTSDYQELANYTGSGNPNGFSYACFKNVTGLLQEFANQGNATYTVGSVYADTGNMWSYAAWSLIIIYASPETRGHQLYIFDDFIYSDMYCNVDFDPDVAPGPGGTISGFLVPDKPEDEDEDSPAARITCFVGEGDDCYDDDFIALNAPAHEYAWQVPDSNKLDDGTSGGDKDNVWNSKSLEISEDGIDIDTFIVTWGDGLLEAGDTSAQVDMWTDVDSWNLVYIILSFRSETVTGGTVTYLIRG